MAVFLNPFLYHCIVLDESQIIKNPDTKVSSAVCLLNAHHKICLTGTPVENHLGEIWSQFAFLIPGLLGNVRDFNKSYRTPIEQKHDTNKQSELAKQLSPFILRRTKLQVESDLPPKEVSVCRIPLNDYQADLYEAVRLSVHRVVYDELAKKGWAASRMVILNALLRLRQVCCHPSLLGLEHPVPNMSGSKFEALMEMLDVLLEEGRSILIFSQFTSMLDILKNELQSRQLPFVEITGNTIDRETPVLKFQRREVQLFLLSLKAGGTGLNLTAADTVIHYDPWWNPAAEEQATDRAHRIGQTKPVFVYKLIAEDKIEERMLDLQDRKRELAKSIYSGKSNYVSNFELSEQDLTTFLAPLRGSAQ